MTASSRVRVAAWRCVWAALLPAFEFVLHGLEQFSSEQSLKEVLPLNRGGAGRLRTRLGAEAQSANC